MPKSVSVLNYMYTHTNTSIHIYIHTYIHIYRQTYVPHECTYLPLPLGYARLDHARVHPAEGLPRRAPGSLEEGEDGAACSLFIRL